MRASFSPGLQAARVLGCGKHFPGLGEGNLDSHHELPVIEKSMKRLVGRRPGSLPELREATAHRDGLARGVSPGHRRHTPASLSKIGSPTSCARDRLSRADRVGRSGNGRRAHGGAHWRSGGGVRSRWRRSVPRLPSGRAHVAGIRSVESRRQNATKIRKKRGRIGAARAGVQEEDRAKTLRCGEIASGRDGREADAAGCGSSASRCGWTHCSRQRTIGGRAA